MRSKALQCAEAMLRIGTKKMVTEVEGEWMGETGETKVTDIDIEHVKLSIHRPKSKSIGFLDRRMSFRAYEPLRNEMKRYSKTIFKHIQEPSLTDAKANCAPKHPRQRFVVTPPPAFR
jgi:hypothetical protein